MTPLPNLLKKDDGKLKTTPLRGNPVIRILILSTFSATSIEILFISQKYEHPVNFALVIPIKE